MDPSTSVMLNRLLERLNHALLGTEQERQSRPSQYERQKIAVNVEHARTLLLTLEKQSSAIKVQSQRQLAQNELQRKRELVKRLNAKLQEFNDAGSSDEDDSEEEDDETEQAAHVKARSHEAVAASATPSYAPARTDVRDSIDAVAARDNSPLAHAQQELRPRRPLGADDNRSAASTTARQQLFAGRSQQPGGDTLLSQREALLSHNRTEQEGLTNGLLGLAQALKQSSQQFAKSLQEEKEVLKRAEGGLDKSAVGMEAAERKMGTLRRMSEGQGWWGRMKLYAFIFGLWAACFLVVFVGPKLRL